MRISDWSSDVCSSDLVDEIRSAGGRAVADTHSVASADGAAAVVATALATFGSLDVLVNNAAISVSAPFDVMTPRSEEHTSELQSLMRISYAVFCLKKKKKKQQHLRIKCYKYKRALTR